MLPLSAEQLVRVRGERAKLQQLVVGLQERLGIEPADRFGDSLRGFLVPVASRISDEGEWVAAAVPPGVCFGGKASELYLYSLVSLKGGARPAMQIGSRREVPDGVHEDSDERLSFPRKSLADVQFYFSEGETAAVYVGGEGDYEEAWVYLRYEGRPVREQIQLVEAILAGNFAPTIQAEALEKVRYLDGGFSDLAAFATLALEKLETDRG